MERTTGNYVNISFASKLRQAFRAVITGTLDDLNVVLGMLLAL